MKRETDLKRFQKPKDDHVLMERNGIQKPVPLWQIDHWKRGNIFHKTGWKYVDEAQGEKLYQGYLDDQREKAADASMAQPTITRDPGIAGAHEARVVTQDPGPPPQEILDKAGKAEDLPGPGAPAPAPGIEVEVHDVLEEDGAKE